MAWSGVRRHLRPPRCRHRKVGPLRLGDTVRSSRDRPHYCTNAPRATAEPPALSIVSISKALTVGADDALIALRNGPPPLRFLSNIFLPRSRRLSYLATVLGLALPRNEQHVACPICGVVRPGAAACLPSPAQGQAHCDQLKETQPAAARRASMLHLTRAKCLAARRTQSGYRLAFHQDRAGIVQVIAIRALVGDILYHGGPERLPAAFRKLARSLGLTPIGRPLQGSNGRIGDVRIDAHCLATRRVEASRKKQSRAGPIEFEANQARSAAGKVRAHWCHMHETLKSSKTFSCILGLIEAAAEGVETDRRAQCKKLR